MASLGTGGIHANVAQELDASDLDGLQGGQLWDNPTRSPTLIPSQFPSFVPTGAPTSHPTLSGKDWTIRGTVWYDRTADGVRNSQVRVDGMGTDVEFTHGLGGVNLRLVQCDPLTERAYVPSAGESLESFANTQTPGVDAHGGGQLAPTHDGNGKFAIHLAPRNGLERYYYVEVQPLNDPFRLTAGICNDDDPGWECNHGNGGQLATPVVNATEPAQGIRSGRSPGCVFIDRQGKVEKLIDFGVMRIGDTQAVGTNIAFVMEFERPRRLADILRRAIVIDEEDDGLFVTTRYLLGDRDKDAIGTVTAEVLSATLDARLAENGVELDSVNPKEVIFSKSSDKSDAGPGGSTSELAVNMEIKAHYSPPPFLDFDYIVQDSINQDTTTIRRGLQEYNDNCRNQKDASSTNNFFSKACSTDLFVPDYFETSLMEIGARDVTNPFKEPENVVYYAREEEAGILEQWAIAPVAGIAGLIVLLAGVFVFRRAIGPRRVDKFSSSNKTKDVASDEMCHFGEAGGDEDDGSVDSAFYTESGSDMEETEKERRMRLKRKAKANEERFNGNNKPRNKNTSFRRNHASSMRKSKRGISMRVERKLLANSQGSGETRGSFSLSEEDAKMKKVKSKRRISTREERKLLAISQGSGETRGSFSLSEEDAKMKKGKSKRRISMREERKMLANSQGSGYIRDSHSSSEEDDAKIKKRKSMRKISMREERKLLAISQGSGETRDSVSLSRDEDAKTKKGYRGNGRKLADSRRGRSKRKGGDNHAAWIAHDESSVV